VALTAYVPHNYPEGLEPGLEETSFYDPSNFCFPFGAHACVVEVDGDTGHVKILRYIAVDDVGNVINPMIVDGMVHGGIAQGVAQALWEGAVYDEESGQLVSGSMMDYALPKADMLADVRNRAHGDARRRSTRSASGGRTRTIARLPSSTRSWTRCRASHRPHRNHAAHA
jgi:CO/xanthine dehydrogenase Mo-binding subunit